MTVPELTVSKGFNSTLIDTLNRLSIRYKHRVGGVSGGVRRSNERGSSNEFSDFRTYTDGDSLRYVDWNSYARLGKLFVKLYMEEKQTRLTVVCDTSGSMKYQSKAYVAGLLSASLCYAALNGGDRASLYMGDKNVALSSKNEVGKLLSFIDGAVYDGVLDIDSEVRLINLDTRGKVCIVSDFLFPVEELEKAVKYIVYKKQELSLVMLLSKEELDPAIVGEVTLKDAETGESVEVDISDDVLKAYAEAVKAHKAAVAEVCRKYGVYLSVVRAEDNFAESLSKVLAG
jgi:uncharacterized protein (DUF58 family)